LGGLYRLGGLKIRGEDDDYDFGSGAGFYVDATEEPWRKGYRMYSYITEELPKALFESFKELDPSRVSITGHSMGGHGALTLVGLPLSLFPSSLLYSMHKSLYLLHRLQEKQAKGTRRLSIPRRHLGLATLMGDSTLGTVPQKPRQIQIRLRLRPDRQPHQLPLGPESFQRLFWRGEQGGVEGA